MKNFSFAIIGGGLTGTAMLYHLATKLKQNAGKCGAFLPKITIQVVEKTNEFGPGYPFSAKQALPIHLISMCAQDMGIVAGNPEDFIKWLHSNWTKLRRRIPDLSAEHSKPVLGNGNCDFYPRIVMGKYLKARFNEAVEIIQKLGLQVDLYPENEVIALANTNIGIQLTLRSVRSGGTHKINASRILLATGHWTVEPTSRVEAEGIAAGNYFMSPWPAGKLLEKIAPGEHVAVLGTSLSACDAVLTLLSDGKFARNKNGAIKYIPSNAPRKVTLYSRHGLLPKVHGRMGLYQNVYFTRENIDRLLTANNKFLGLEKVFSLLNADLEAAYGHPINWQEVMAPKKSPTEIMESAIREAQKGDGLHGELLWQTVLHQSFAMLRHLYLNLAPQDRQHFDRQLSTLFFCYAATLPPVIAQKLITLMKAGLVNVVKLGSEYSLSRENASGGFEFIYLDDNGLERKDFYNYVVNATGQKTSFETCPAELAKNLLRSGLVQIEELAYDTVEAPRSRIDAKKRSLQKINMAENSQAQRYIYRTGAVWIDPETQQVLSLGPDGNTAISSKLYAVGAMTRGQIIDASMSYASALATADIAEQVVDDLIKQS
ncbi:MAG: FAD/NAD(P)-binding protein [Deltaproteobacteria bacterium]|nr:MAG: FAD/NAD(P)-binding protein [Deltaproteobacteria bacterium]